MSPTFFSISWFALPLLVWGGLLCYRRRVGLVWGWFVVLSSVVFGIFLLANYVWALDAQLLAEIDKYEPGTPEAQRASEEWASDTDRSFLLLLSPALTAIWYGVLFTLLLGLQRLIFRMLPAKELSQNSVKEIETAQERVVDSNPYRSPNVG